MKELRGIKERDWTDIKSVPMNNAGGQQALLSEGYRGFEMEKTADTFIVKFGR